MKLTANDLAMTATLTLTERELIVIKTLCEYDIARLVREHVTSQFKLTELEEMAASFKSEVGRLVAHFDQVRAVYSGEKIAAPILRPPNAT